LAEDLLFGKLENGGHVRIVLGDDDTLELIVESAIKELEQLRDDN
jgi:hypothetical protein